MIKKYISASGITIEIGDFYGGGTDEVVSSLEEKEHSVTINTNLGFYTLPLSPGDYLGFQDGSGRIITKKTDDVHY